MTWILPSGVGVGFTGASSVGRVRNSSDDQFSATLTSKMEDEDPDSDDLFFTSTLLIIDPVNGSELVCSGTAAGGTVFQRSVIALSSGKYIYYSTFISSSLWKYYANSRHTRPSY